MGLAGDGRPEQGDVAVGCDERERGEVADLADVEIGLEGEVELLEGLVVGQPGQLQRGAEPAPFAQAEFFAEDGVDELAVAHAVGLGAVDEQVEVLGQVREPESGGVGLDPGVDQLAHAAPTSGSATWAGPGSGSGDEVSPASWS